MAATQSKTEAPPEQLQLPLVDGEGIDKIRAKFGGQPFLDRSNARDVALIRDLKMGNTVFLLVEAKVGPPVPSMSTNKDGDLDVLTMSRMFTVQQVWQPTPESMATVIATVPDFAPEASGDDEPTAEG